MRTLAFIAVVLIALAHADNKNRLIFTSGPKSLPVTQSMTPAASAGSVSATNFTITTQFWVSHWTKVNNPNTSMNAGAIVGNLNNANGYGWDTFNVAGLNGDTGFGYQPRLSFDNNGATSLVAESTTIINTDGNWHHTVVSYDGTNTFPGSVTMWVDGALQPMQNDHDATLTGNCNGNNAFLLGARGGTPLVRTFNGLISMVAVGTGQATQQMVNALYNNGTPVDIASLSLYSTVLVWYPIAYLTDTVSLIHDLKAGNNMTGNGSVTFVTDVP